MRGDRDGVADQVVEVQASPIERSLLQQRADASEHLTRAITILDDTPQRVTRLSQIGRIGIEPAQSGVAAHDHRGERLVHFVRDRGGDLSHHHHSTGVRQLRLREPQRFLCALALRYVDHNPGEQRRRPGIGQDRRCTDFGPHKLSILAAQAHLDASGCLADLRTQPRSRFHSDVTGREEQELLVRVADHLLKGRIGGDKPSIQLQQADAHRCVLEETAPPLLACLGPLDQRLLRALARAKHAVRVLQRDGLQEGFFVFRIHG